MNEFDFINNIKERYGLSRVGDDCAVVPKDDSSDLLITSDLLVEDIDFNLEWAIPELLGHKALAVSLSDIAAMGGMPTWAMLSLGIPEMLWKSDLPDRFMKGWTDLAAIFDVELIGGDISRSPDKLFFDTTIGGQVPKGSAILRSGGKPGEGIYVTGPLGGAAGGLRLLGSGIQKGGGANPDQEALIMKQLRPLPQLRIGDDLRTRQLAHSMIDISDGLSSDLAHLCNASHVGAVINANDLPFEGELISLTGSINAMLELVLHGGEDFELLFTGDDEKISKAGIGEIFRIGEVTANVGIIELIKGEERLKLSAKGYRHF